jgi:hypothetical protein
MAGKRSGQRLRSTLEKADLLHFRFSPRVLDFDFLTGWRADKPAIIEAGAMPTSPVYHCCAF